MHLIEALLRFFYWVPNALTGYRGLVAAPAIAIAFVWEAIAGALRFFAWNAPRGRTSWEIIASGCSGSF